MATPKLATIENLKVPPHSIEGEQAVLGGLLLSPLAWDLVADVVTEADFYREVFWCVSLNVCVCLIVCLPQCCGSLS